MEVIGLGVLIDVTVSGIESPLKAKFDIFRGIGEIVFLNDPDTHFPGIPAARITGLRIRHHEQLPFLYGQAGVLFRKLPVTVVVTPAFDALHRNSCKVDFKTVFKLQ